MGSLGKNPAENYIHIQTDYTPVLCDGVVVSEECSLSDIEFTEKEDGYITLHSEPEIIKSNGVPIKHAPYVLGGDTSGLADDFYTGKMINNITGKTVATLRVKKIDEDIYAEHMLCLAEYYCKALIAIETNYSRQPIRIIEQKYYSKKIYRR